MSDPLSEITVPARFAALPELLGHLCRQARAAGIGDACQQRMQLVVEELFANTIHHGLGGECDAPVRLAVACADGSCRLHYSDSAPPFDPMQAPLSGTALDRPGGVGIAMVRRLSDSILYRRVAGNNFLDIVFAA